MGEGPAGVWAKKQIRMSAAKKKGRTPKPVRAARPIERVRRETLIERRDRCMSTIARQRGGAHAAGSLANKARLLLTKHWATASWHARAELVRTAEWLVGIGRGMRASARR